MHLDLNPHNFVIIRKGKFVQNYTQNEQYLKRLDRSRRNN